jgi:diacylglycerol kinase family enzyme
MPALQPKTEEKKDAFAMTPARLAFIVNPAASRCPPDAESRFRARFPGAPVWTTRQPGEAAVLAERATAAGHDTVVACGGDGTFREVASAVGHRATLGFVPLGTVNLVARELGIPLGLEPSFAILDHGMPAQVFGGRFFADGESAGKLFFIGVSAGPDADSVHAVTGREKARLGRYSYALRFAARLLRPVEPDLRFRIGSKESRCSQIVILNLPHYGGWYRFSEGLSLFTPGLEVVSVETQRLAVLRLFWSAVRGRVLPLPGVSRTPAHEVRVDLPPHGRCQIDGDPFFARALRMLPDPTPFRVLVDSAPAG